MGEVVHVKDGFARNFLLPQGKALRATKDNRAKFETMKGQLEVRNLERKGDAEKVGTKLGGQSFIVIRQASETGQLYGSVSPRDIVSIVENGGFTVSRGQIVLHAPIKTIGLHKVPVALHPEIEVSITISVARSADEAERIARGENVMAQREERLVMATGEAVDTEEFFENPEAVAAKEGEGAEPAAKAEEGALFPSSAAGPQGRCYLILRS